jgi:hypothetical protein
VLLHSRLWLQNWLRLLLLLLLLLVSGFLYWLLVLAHSRLRCVLQLLFIVLLVQLRLLQQHECSTRQLLLALQQVNQCAACPCVLR